MTHPHAHLYRVPEVPLRPYDVDALTRKLPRAYEPEDRRIVEKLIRDAEDVSDLEGSALARGALDYLSRQ